MLHTEDEPPLPEGTSVNQCSCNDRPGRNLVVCIDGTSNQFGDKNTNVVELYSRLEKSASQLTYYNSGIGTYATPSWRSLSWWTQVLAHKIDLAIAWRFERILLSAYEWLSENYAEGDRIYLFGFSRGAYQVRVISGMIAKVGLIHKGNKDQIPFAYELYAATKHSHSKVTAEQSATAKCERFKETFSRPDVKVHFVGVWDTVSSVGIVRDKTLPDTTTGMKHVCIFRHALALDERRVKFLPEYAYGGDGPPQEGTATTGTVQIKEVWFAGSHSDIGGGNVENTDLNRFGPAIRWMSYEAIGSGLKMKPFIGQWKNVAPTTSLTAGWWPLELLPIRRLSYADASSTDLLPHLGAARVIRPGQLIHQSVLDEFPEYKPMARLYEGLSWDAGRDCVESVIEKDPYTSAVSVLYRLEKSPGDYRDLDVLTYLLNTESGRRSLQEVPNAAHILLQVLRAQSDDGVRTDDIPGFLVESVLSDLRQDACSQASLAVLGTLQQTGSVRRSLRNFPGAIEVLSAALRRQSEGTALENANVLPAVVITLTMDALKDEPYNLRYLDALMALHSTKHGLNALRARSDVIEPLFSVMLSLRQDVHDEAERLKVIRALVSILNDIAAFTTVNRQPAPSIYAVMPILLKGCEEDSAAAQLLMKQFISDMVMKPLEGHTGPVICIAFSRDGKCLASGSSDKTLRLWNTETGTLVSPQPVGHEDHVYCVAFSPTGRCVASGSKDHTIRLWDPETGPTPTTTFRGHSDTIFSISFSPDGRRLASASGDCTLRAWDVITGLTVVGPLEGHEATVESVSFSPDGHQIVSGSWDKTIRIWNADTGEMLVGPMQGHKESVFSVAFNPDGRLVASGSEDKTIRIWDAETGRQVVDPLRGHKSWVRSVAFSPDGNFVASGSDDKTVRLWDVSTGEMIAGPFEGHTDQLRSVVISPDGKRVASCSIDKTIRLWDATGHWPHEDAEGNGNMVSPYLAHAALVGLSKDAANRVYLNTMKRLESTVSGRRALRQAPDIVPMLLSILQTQSQVAGLDDMKLIPNILVSVILDRFRKDPCNEECIQALASIQGTAHGHIVLRERHDVSRMLSVVIQSLKSRISDKSDWLRTTRIAVDILNCTGFQALAGRHTGAEIRSFVHILLKGSEDDRAAARQFIEKFGSALALRPLEGHTDRVNSVVFSGDGTRIASGSYDKTLHIWDAATGTPVSVPFARCKICIYSIAFSPSGQLIVVCGKDNVIQLWDWEKEEAPRERFRGHTASVFCVAFSPDGKRVASGSADLTIRIWDVDTGQTVVGPIEAHTAVIESIAFSPDGCFLASGSRDKTIRVWNAHTGQPVAAPLEGHTESVFSVAFSLGSDRVISGSRDKTIRIWSVATARSVASPLKGHTDWVRCVAIAPNGKHIVSGSDDKTIRLWDVEAGAEIAQPFEGHTASVRSVAFSPDGRRVVSGSVDNTVRVWDVTREWIKWDADSEDELSENEVGLSVH